MTVHIRQSKPEDLGYILQLQADSLRILSNDYNLSQIESLIKSQKSARLSSDETTFIAELNSRIIGFSCFIDARNTIGGVYVHPDFVRRGIGTKLLNAVEEVAIQRKCQIIYVTSSLSSVDFYKANGYQVVRNSGFLSDLTTWIECVNLEKKLGDIPELEGCFYWFIDNFLPFLKFGFGRIVNRE